ncbi:gamma-glutamylcyclotransferase family protein [Microbacterium dauci]|uniref:Gamma-glutamylcyclotransferase family protein n=1 Tax=Microbacterium dauci TaxID=3048008 RepID=A0ABT6ZAK7_9MICO|nr:gamma-glutamylcyclotransferase family protein [Microbacterium sp. LX3-4]MDJ1113189.1 gamma-glutamylcyclotransferase family protein [Microbacterium sp. LX3-4]
MTVEPADQLLFTYDTLQHAEVQLDTFGRIPESEPDILPGYTVDYAEIEDPRVVERSGLGSHPILRATGNPVDKVVGRVLRVTAAEIDAADEYEVALYHRVAVVLTSGRTAWVYVG